MGLEGWWTTIWDTALIRFVPFLFVLTVIVFFHELGHYLVGRWSGIRILAFSVGFGPELVGFTDRHGTRWKLSAIPLGGYVKFFGDENAASVPDREALGRMTEAERGGAFHTTSVGRRAATVAAGPVANFILAIAIFALTAFSTGIMVGDPVVSEVRPGSPPRRPACSRAIASSVPMAGRSSISAISSAMSRRAPAFPCSSASTAAARSSR